MWVYVKLLSSLPGEKLSGEYLKGLVLYAFLHLSCYQRI